MIFDEKLLYLLPLLLILLAGVKIRAAINRNHVRRLAKKAALILIQDHAKILSKKKNKCISIDDYGVARIKGWDEEKVYFIENVLKPKLKGWNFILTKMDVDAAIEAAILRLPPEDPIPFSPQMSPLKYEEMCADLLNREGWLARTTKASGDQGADVIADRHGLRVVLQCKMYSRPVGNAAVQEVFGARAHQNADFAAVVSNAGYTAAAKELAISTGVALLHHEDLRDWGRALVSAHKSPPKEKRGSGAWPQAGLGGSPPKRTHPPARS